MVEYKFNFEKFQRGYKKLCPCLVPSKDTAIQENMCPCTEFTDNGACRCGLFVKVE
jgi:ferredoxin-thioredoxin reductase catalytic subunit